jgi:hypothetical protein
MNGRLPNREFVVLAKRPNSRPAGSTVSASSTDFDIDSDTVVTATVPSPGSVRVRRRVASVVVGLRAAGVTLQSGADTPPWSQLHHAQCVFKLGTLGRAGWLRQWPVWSPPTVPPGTAGPEPGARIKGSGLTQVSAGFSHPGPPRSVLRTPRKVLDPARH